jgi:hypothetical protein
MLTNSVQTDLTSANYRFKSPGSRIVETFCKADGRWRIGLEGDEFDLTAAQARILAAELIDAAAGAEAMNRERFGIPAIGGREVLIVQDQQGSNRACFADGEAHVVVRITSTDDGPDAEPRYCVRESHNRDMAVTTKKDGFGKHKYTITYTPIGAFELVMADPGAGCVLLARVEGI